LNSNSNFSPEFYKKLNEIDSPEERLRQRFNLMFDLWQDDSWMLWL
jgi:hypothetical protein